MPRTNARTLRRLPKCQAVLELAAQVIHQLSIEQGRLFSLRNAVLHGADLIQNDKRTIATYLVRNFDRELYRGDESFHISFDKEDWMLVDSCKQRLQALAGSPLTNDDILLLTLRRCDPNLMAAHKGK